MSTLTPRDELRVLRSAYTLMTKDLRRSLYAVAREVVHEIWKVDVGDEQRLADQPPDLQVRVCDVLALVASLRHVVLDGAIGPDDFQPEPVEDERAGWRCKSCGRTLMRTDDVVRVQVGRAYKAKSFAEFHNFGNVCWDCFRDWCGDPDFVQRRIHRQAMAGEAPAAVRMVTTVRRRRARRAKT